MGTQSAENAAKSNGVNGLFKSCRAYQKPPLLSKINGNVYPMPRQGHVVLQWLFIIVYPNKPVTRSTPAPPENPLFIWHFLVFRAIIRRARHHPRLGKIANVWGLAGA